MKKLGFGLMRLPVHDPSAPDTIDLEQVNEMVDRFLENGFTYFDTAWMYNGFKSENAVKEVLVKRHPRESFSLTTKLHYGFFDTLEGRDVMFNAQMEKTGAGYFDYYFLHDIEEASYEKYKKFDCFNWIMKKKEDGLVKHIGFSFHDSPELLDRVLTEHPEMEVVQIQLNYLDWESEWIQARANYEVCVKHNKPVIVMEPVKGGSLAEVPEAAAALFKEADPAMSVASWAIRFAASLPQVMMVLSGMSTMEQLEDNMAYMKDLKPLTDAENELCFRAAKIINDQIAVPCTGCSYCTEGCPEKIAIPQYFSLYNEIMREDLAKKGWTIYITNYEVTAEKHGKASDCIGCGQCEAICPQKLPIIENLQKVADRFEHGQ